jgi:hypothetical protein
MTAAEHFWTDYTIVPLTEKPLTEHNDSHSTEPNPHLR